MSDKESVWNNLVKKHNLLNYTFRDAAAWPFADAVFNLGYDVMSDTTKSRRFGFHQWVETEEMLMRLFSQFRKCGSFHDGTCKCFLSASSLNPQLILTTEDNEYTEDGEYEPSPLRPRPAERGSTLPSGEPAGRMEITFLSRRFLPEDIGNVLRRDWLFGVVVRRQGFRGLQIAIDRSLWKILEEQLDPSGFLLPGDFGDQLKGQIDAAGNPAGCPNIAALHHSFFCN